MYGWRSGPYPLRPNSCLSIQLANVARGNHRYHRHHLNNLRLPRQTSLRLKMEKMKRKYLLIALVIVGTICVIIGHISFSFYASLTPPPPPPTPTPTHTPEESPTPTEETKFVALNKVVGTSTSRR